MKATPTSPHVGDSVICKETGKHFVVKQEGHTFNYAIDSQGNIYSDEGVHLREVKQLLDRSKPFTGYLSSDGKHLTGWKGNVLGTVTYRNTIPLTRTSFTHGSTIDTVQIRDVHGQAWYGRGNNGIAITIRPLKAKQPKPYTRKTTDEYHVHVNYGHGWEHETTEPTFKQAKEQAKTYRENQPHPVKITGPHRVKITEE